MSNRGEIVIQATKACRAGVSLFRQKERERERESGTN